MKNNPRQLRLDDEVEKEVKEIAKLTKLPEIEIIRQMVSAGVSAIKANGYKLPLPLRLTIIGADSVDTGKMADKIVHEEYEKIINSRKDDSSPADEHTGHKREGARPASQGRPPTPKLPAGTSVSSGRVSKRIRQRKDSNPTDKSKGPS